MLEFSIDFPALVAEIEKRLDEMIDAWRVALDAPTRDNLSVYANSQELLAARIAKVCDLIKERQELREPNDVDPEPPAPRVSVDQQKNIVYIDGEAHPVSPDTATLIAAVVDARGEYISASNVVKQPARLMNNAPADVEGLIDRSNHGYRLKKEWVMDATT